MRRGGPAARALAARGFQAAATDSDEESLLAEALAVSLRISEPTVPLAGLAAGEAEAADDAGWELVGEPEAEPVDPATSNLARARRAGAFARRKLVGELQAVPRSPAPAGGVRNAHYVVLRTPKAGGWGIGSGPWSEFARYVQSAEGRLERSAVFHGFSSLAEAQAYFEEAGFVGPAPTLAPWRW